MKKIIGLFAIRPWRVRLGAAMAGAFFNTKLEVKLLLHTPTPNLTPTRYRNAYKRGVAILGIKDLTAPPTDRRRRQRWVGPQGPGKGFETVALDGSVA